jgi:hypothetical protein
LKTKRRGAGNAKSARSEGQSRLDPQSLPHTNTFADQKYFNFFGRSPDLARIVYDTCHFFQAIPGQAGFVDEFQGANASGPERRAPQKEWAGDSSQG